MDGDAGAVIAAILARAGRRPRTVVGIAGPPAAGKSRLATRLADRLHATGNRAVVVPMDGFHFDDAVLARRGRLSRKGAPDTFDVAGFEVLLRRIRRREPDVAIPVFDRALECSRAAADIVPADAGIIIVEGNYLLLERMPWSRLRGLFDLTVFLRVPVVTLDARLVARWRRYGRDETEARAWIDGNDLPNARLVLAESGPSDLVIG